MVLNVNAPVRYFEALSASICIFKVIGNIDNSGILKNCGLEIFTVPWK